MAGLFGSPAKPDPLPPPPDRSAADLQEAAGRQRDRFYGAQGGRAWNILTGGTGAGTGRGGAVRMLGGVGQP